MSHQSALLLVLLICPHIVLAQDSASTGSASTILPSAPPKESKPDRVALIPPEDNQYRIGPGDLLSIQIFNRTQLSLDVHVDARGMIKVPLVEGEIQAACRTQKELAEEIAHLYQEQKLLKNPQVSVAVRDYQSQVVAVLGAVNSPGRFQLQRRVRLLELLVFHAGGPSVKAGRSVQILSTGPANSCQESTGEVVQSEVARVEPEISQSLTTYRLSEILRGGAAPNPFVRPGDIISIPEAGQAFVVGNVLNPSPIQITETITLSQAIAMAGGTLPDTRREKVHIIRQAPGSTTRTEIFADLNAIDKRRADDVVLQDGDVINVPSKTGLQKILKGILQSIVPQGSLPVRVIR